MAKGAYIGVGTHTKLDYIESTGTQYIDTGIIGRSGLEFYLDFEYTDANVTDQAIIGTRNGTVRFFPVLPKESSSFVGYGNAIEISTIYEAGVRYNVYARFHVKDQIVERNGETIYSGTISGDKNTEYTMPLLALNMNGEVGYFAKAKIWGCKILDGGVLVRDFVPCKSAAGDVGMYDRVTNAFFGNAGTGTFIAGESVGTLGEGIARKVKKMYIGVDGVARKIKKAYIGIGGVARPCFGGGGLEYYGQITNLNDKRQSCAATQIGKHALFAGGSAKAVTQTTSAVGSVYAYNESLTRTRPTALSTSRGSLAATTVGNMALFLGGYNGGSVYSADCYSETLTKENFVSAKYARHNHAATTVGNYALFAGGYSSSASDAVNSVESVDSSGTQKLERALKTIRYCLAATTVGDYALFGGGIDADPDATVDAYNTGLTKTIPTGLSEARYYLAATTVGDYALFGGGMGKSKYYATVDAYDKSLTRTTPAPLSAARQRLDAATIGGYAVFGCGLIGGGEKNVVDVYDESLTLTQTTPFSVPRYHYSAVTVGDYILFGGGQNNEDTVLTTVEAYVCERPE